MGSICTYHAPDITCSSKQYHLTKVSQGLRRVPGPCPQTHHALSDKTTQPTLHWLHLDTHSDARRCRPAEGRSCRPPFCPPIFQEPPHPTLAHLTPQRHYFETIVIGIFGICRGFWVQLCVMKFLMPLFYWPCLLSSLAARLPRREIVYTSYAAKFKPA